MQAGMVENCGLAGLPDWRHKHTVIAGHSRPKDGVASLAYDPPIQDPGPTLEA